jgi:hypothetical protein
MRPVFQGSFAACGVMGVPAENQLDGAQEMRAHDMLR